MQNVKGSTRFAQDIPKSSLVVLSDTHQVSISQQMSPVITFDIAVVPQKVKVQFWGPVCYWKSGVVVLGH